MAKERKAKEPQVNIRVTQETLDVLDAAVFVDRLRGSQELLRPVVEQLVARLVARPEVEAALRARQEGDAGHAGKLGRLPKKTQAPTP